MPRTTNEASELEPTCWVNGRRADLDAATVSARDRGFALADGCFETMRAYSGILFRLDAHLARLACAADRLSIPVPPHLDETVSEAVRVLHDARANAAVRLTLTRGVGAGIASARGAPPTTVLVIDRLPMWPSHTYSRGLSAHVAVGRRNEFAPTAGLKTLSYTDAILALMAARQRGVDEALLCDTEGHLSEGSASNVFLVIRGVVHTPPEACGALPGITRGAVLEILRCLEIPVKDTPVPREALEAADEVFLTSSLREIAAVTTVDNRPIGSGRVGPTTVSVVEAYTALVAEAVADGLT
jgi:branched-chain amino acid aminotransferase